MTTFLVKSQLKHDGEIYPIDSSIELDAKVAKSLLADGVIAKIPLGPAKTGKEPTNMGASRAKSEATKETKEEEKTDADNL